MFSDVPDIFVGFIFIGGLFGIPLVLGIIRCWLAVRCFHYTTVSNVRVRVLRESDLFGSS